MKKTRNAFTLTELLVALGVVAVLTAILMPIIINLMPNQNTLMAKRAYYTVQTLVSDLINDEACYPDRTTDATDPKVGFDDAAGSPNCSGWTNTEATDSADKFKTLFTKKLGKEADSNGRFETDDGMSWAFTNAAFDSTDDDGGSIELTVDVNGNKGNPNCAGDGSSYSTELGSGEDSACSGRANGYDRFKMIIKGNGQVSINETWAKNAVKVDRNITSDKNSNDEDEE